MANSGLYLANSFHQGLTMIQIRIAAPGKLLAATVLLAAAVPLPFLCAADAKPTPTIEGYVTAVRKPGSFDVNGAHVTTGMETVYNRVTSKGKETSAAGPDDIVVGAYVEVCGAAAGPGITADAVTIRQDTEKEPKGFGLILKVVEPGPEPVFDADGYRIRITTKTAVSFAGQLKSMADVEAGTWIKYAGGHDNDETLVAAEAQFFSGTRNSFVTYQEHPERAKPDSIPAGATLVASDGAFVGPHSKIRMSDAGGWCGWHKIADDPNLQSRVWRVGMSVVPDFQKQMAANDRLKIQYRFFAVEDDKVRSELFCSGGVVLVPRTVAERLKTDAELAAVLADGVAWFLEWQSVEVLHHSEEAGLAEGAVGLLAGLPGDSALSKTVETPLSIALRKQRDRISLTLLSNAGYDPWAAPEAWRLLSVKDLPSDLATLKYPTRSGYQLAILNQAYKKNAAKSGKK